MSLAAQLEADPEVGKAPEPKSGAKQKRASTKETATASVFDLANRVDTIAVLDRLHISHEESKRGETATCPGCNRDGALVCDGGGLKCLFATCAPCHPNPEFAGFRTNVDLVALAGQINPPEAARRICEWFDIKVPEPNGSTSGPGYEPPPGRFDDESEDVPPNAPPAAKDGESRNDGASSVAAGVVWHDARAIFAPLPPTKWIVQGLQICPGRPTLWCGYGYVGKSITEQSLALAMATGMPAFGEFEVRRGIVRHFDHEQGKHATFKRYQRVAIGMGIEDVEADGHLFAAIFPNVYLNQDNAVDVYSRLCEGTDLAIIDALRGATPGEDENDSKIRRCLDNLARVSERTGTTFTVLHHAGKPNDAHGGDQRMKARGSSAIFDAAGPVFILSGTKESPHKLVSQQKAPAEAEGGAVEDFYLTVEDVPRGTNPKAGVRVTYRAKEASQGKAAAASTDAQDGKVLDAIRANPGCNVRELRALCRPLQNGLVEDAVSRLVMAGKVELRDGKRSAIHHHERVSP
jgi:hypothetical protein